MKTSCLALALLISTIGTYGQVASQGAASINSQSTAVQAAKLPPPPPYAVTKQDGNSKVWERTVYEPGPNGQAIPKKHSYTEVGTGMNYQDAQGNWQPSVAGFHMARNFFVADKVPTKVMLAPNLNVIGAVTTTTADGITLRSTPVAIALYDAASGNSLVIGVVTNCTGELVAGNQVVYANAFSGVNADVYYTIKRGTFDQDVVLTGRLNPEDYGFPTNTTRIQILTEFYQPDKPEKIRRPLYVEKNEAVRNQMATPDLMDETLNFGQLVFGHGKAYTSATPNGAGTPVAKEYKTISGRTFLIETVRYKSIRKELDSLPDSNIQASSTKLQLRKQSGKAYAAIPRPGTSPRTGIASISKSRPLLALNRRTGVVIDYVTIYGTFDDAAVFKGDTTYIVDYPSYYEGAVTIEGGTVIKYVDPAYSSGPAWIQIDNSLACDTSAYRPAIFTAADDHTVGEDYSVGRGGFGSYPFPYPSGGGIDPNGYASPALLINNFDSTGDQTIGNLRFRYAVTAIELNPVDSETLFTVNDSQFMNCVKGLLVLDGFSCGAGGEAMNNCLMANVQYPSVVEVDYNYFNYSDNYIIDDNQSWNNCTIANAARFYTASFTFDEFSTGWKYPHMGCYNCVFADMTAITDQYTFIGGDYNGFYDSPAFGSDQFTNSSYPFQTVGAGSYYLTNASSFHNQGLSAYDSSDLLADLATKTTHPPVVYSDEAAPPPVIVNQVPTDTGSAPDLGYHYDRIDCLFSNWDLATSYSDLTLNPGTIASGAISVYYSGILSFQGTPAQPCLFVDYDTVQEVGNISNLFSGISFLFDSPASTVDAQFTKFFGMPTDSHIGSGAGSGTANIKDCEFYGGAISLGGALFNITNSLFAETYVNINGTDGYGYGGWVFQNCLFWNGTFSFSRGSSSFYPLTIKDSVFDGPTFHINDLLYGNTSYTALGYNAFLTGADWTGGAHDVIESGFTWQSSWLGNYYQPTNSPLINKGNVTADQIGLYYFTTQTNQVPETNSTVDIGYHYVATDAYGNPLETETNSSEGTNFWVVFFNAYEGPFYQTLSLAISSPVGAMGKVTISGLGITNTFSVAAGSVTNVSIPFAAMITNYDVIQTEGIHVTASAPVAVYGLEYESQASVAFTGYPTPLLGTTYCLMAYSARSTGENGISFYSQFAVVATANDTTVTITPAPTADLAGHSDPYTITLQQGQTYQINGSIYTDDITGTWITSDKPVGVFAGSSLGDVTPWFGDANPLVQEQLPVESWGKQALSMGFAGRGNGDSYRILAAYDNTMVTITGSVVTVLDAWDGIITNSNEAVMTNLNAGQFCDIIVEGPVQFQATQPVQVAHFANGSSFDDGVWFSDVEEPYGGPSEILLPPTGHYLKTNTVVTLPNDDVTGDFPENYLNIIVPQSAITNTLVDGSHIATTNFVVIGTSGYYGAQITVTNSGVHKVISSQPVGVEVYGFGGADAYGYFGGVFQ
jgi:hypothetical protein